MQTEKNASQRHQKKFLRKINRLCFHTKRNRFFRFSCSQVCIKCKKTKKQAKESQEKKPEKENVCFHFSYLFEHFKRFAHFAHSATFSISQKC